MISEVFQQRKLRCCQGRHNFSKTALMLLQTCKNSLLPYLLRSNLNSSNPK